MQNETYTFIGSLTTDERRSIEMFYQAFNDRDLEIANEAVIPAWQYIPLAPGQGPGAYGLKPILEALTTASPDIKIAIKEVIGAPGHAAVRAEITGTHQGEWFGIAPTGKAVSVAVQDLHHLQEGKITHTWHLEDWFGMLNQIGEWPGR